MSEIAKQEIQKIFSLGDIVINGKRPWDITVHDDRFYQKVLAGGSLALGESYMDGWWDAETLDQFFFHVRMSDLDQKAAMTWKLALQYVFAKIINAQSKARAFQVGEKHYDLGNDLYTDMLDTRMVYTCAYWKDAQTLDEAQEHKLDLVCRKLNLQKGQKILDIGCGWGSFMKFAAEKYSVSCVGLTISKEQAALGAKRCAGLPIEFRIQDYRDTHETFDHIVSLGMFEHVGPKNYRTYMEVARRCLKDDGLFLLHTIGVNGTKSVSDPWILKYIFPNGYIPTMQQITRAIDDLFLIEDAHNFGAYYDTTIMAWYKNFNASWPQLKGTYDERFRRMWNYYLCACAGTFRARKAQLWQIVLSKNGIPGGYRSVR